jgi:exodeoxyribonuclease VII small subunit
MTDLSTLSFEQLIDALEGITRRMASGDIGIEAVADLYEEAGRLHQEAAERLERVRRRLDVLAADEGADGREPGATAGDQRPQT